MDARPSSESAPPEGASPPPAAWEEAEKRLRRIEAAWEKPARRVRAILECRNWMEEQGATPHLPALARLLSPEMDRRALWCALAPVERAAARRRVTDLDLLENDLPPGTGPAAPPLPLTVVADDLRSAFNLGGILRTAECFGCEAVWTCGYTAEASTPQVAAAAMGAERLVATRAFARLDDAIDALHARGAKVFALETVRDAVDLDSFAWEFPCGLLLGNERFGIRPDALAKADAIVRIPLRGRKNSLNVACACAIALASASRAFATLPRPS
ncbi:MAG: TrmH family RNA methyltransferase [Kiritimatiellia bacterium]|jgi:23S rRNA (guanosine2251-2'-O)-methyltransferase